MSGQHVDITQPGGQVSKLGLLFLVCLNQKGQFPVCQPKGGRAVFPLIEHLAPGSKQTRRLDMRRGSLTLPLHMSNWFSLSILSRKGSP